MATTTDIAASLTMDDIPVKLRCATCNKLANNAFRMPCCDQSICEDCQASLPEACPVCYHEPVKPDDCRPNKALRTTVKVFLKKKVVERENAEKKRIAAEKAAATPATPLLEETPASRQNQIPSVAPDASTPATSGAVEAKRMSRDVSQRPQTPNNVIKEPGPATPTEAQKDVPQMSVEFPDSETARRASTQTTGEGSIGQESGTQSEKLSEQQQAMGQNQQWAASNGFEQGMNNGAMGLQGAAGGFPNMGMNGMGDFSQMMNLMPNGMPNPMMGSLPNMMGMPGMGMDPMAMSQMYGGFGGQGMGMNSMNMGMGFDAGQGAFGGFNGQPTQWNAGQNNFNQNAYGNRANMGGIGGDFGTNAGYGGYNMPSHQGNYNQMHQHQYPNNDFHQGHHGQGFQYRGRGRGRGYFNTGRGRGGYNQYNQYNQTQGNQTNNEAFHQQFPEVTRRGSPSYGPQEDRPAQKADDEEHQDAKAEDATNNVTAEEQLNKELDPGDAGDNDEIPKDSASKEDPQDEAVAQNPDSVLPETKTSDQPEAVPALKEEDEKPAPIQTFVSDEPSKPERPPTQTDATVSSSMPPPPGPIVPTGPAADQSMDTSPRGRGTGRTFGRGADYRGGSHGRGSGYLPNGSINHAQSIPQPVKPIVPPVAPKGLGVEGAPTAPKALREGQPNTSIRGFSIVGRASAAAQARPGANAAAKSTSRDRSRSRSRSPSRHRSSHHRHRRHRSASRSSSNERERRKERRHRHSRRHDVEDGDEYHDTKEPRHRDGSAESSKRSSHRSRKHHDEDRDKDVERSSHRAHRSHRDRSRDGPREDRESKKREKSPELVINGASRRKAANDDRSSRHKDTEDTIAPSSSSRKRRSEDEYENDYRESKRKRRAEVEDNDRAKEKEREREKLNGHRSSRSGRHDSLSSHVDKPPENPLQREPPKGPKQDSNSMLSEREKYAAERIARENQRRLSQLGGAGGGRRVSHKYEDEETVSVGEKEREALRYR